MKKKSFMRLAWQEEHALRQSRQPGARPVKRDELRTTRPGITGEPRVTFRTEARAGLALSGGGIRSATFALGVLQAMETRGILKHFDFLSTVSGGGYAGAYWTRRRAAAAAAPPGTPPLPVFVNPADSGGNEAEPAPVRHMREYSHFLAPRLGLLTMDVWWPLAVVLAGTALTLLAGGALILLVMTLWAWAADSRPHVILMATLTFVFILVREGNHYLKERVQGNSKSVRATIGAALLAVLAWRAIWEALPHPQNAGGLFPADWEAMDLHGLFSPVYAWLLTAFAVGGLARMLHARSTGKGGAAAGALERATGRILGMAALWAAPAGIWAAAQGLHFMDRNSPGVSGSIGAGLAALFVLIRKWADGASAKKVSATIFDKIRAHLVQVVAVLTLFMLFLTAALALIGWKAAGTPMAWGMPAGWSAGVLAAAVLLYRPNRMGLHSFYRTRIARCYLGAATATRDSVRYSAETKDDDMLFAHDTGRPLHLVCCAANHLAGDLLPTLYRGARSAVLSRNGLSMGNEWNETPAVRLSSAVTASAAAFNSQMGSISQRLGAPVSFLAALLNLRLGLWLPSPKARGREPVLNKYCPGVAFFLEALNGTRTDGPMLHLSDGGHFENLAAYELIRRCCRYVVIVDASADPERNFENLGNLVRRVRADFGAEIELDTRPLKPGGPGNLSKAYAVTGSITYKGENTSEKGLLIYIKPALTGDEPADILQYHEARADFPHETTADQFFDESQWESYRRLGQFAACELLEGIAPAATRDVHGVFDTIRRNLVARPWDETAAWNRLSDLTRKIEEDMSKSANGLLMWEAWPEAAQWRDAGRRAAPVAHDDEVLSACARLLTGLEEVWVDTAVSQVSGEGIQESWLNWISRWLTIPSVRKWWPLLQPACGRQFQGFATGCGLPAAETMAVKMRVSSASGPEWRQGFAGSQYPRSAQPTGTLWVARLTLLHPDFPGGAFEGGLVFFKEIPWEGKAAIVWDAHDVWLPPGWMGAWTTVLLQTMTNWCRAQKRCVRMMVQEINQENLAATEVDYLSHGFRARNPRYQKATMVCEVG